ncbi:unnamed protein product [Spirodela intermedia]|uniref:Uncharacterized protein n=1 Tax=Spirodela intermedia TaxID=51605 RepID=A0ABN7ECL0_SPIIN|nr:unnamed protein product [Spirodela intermedia]
MGESLTEQCRVEVEGPRVVNFFSRRRSNDVFFRFLTLIGSFFTSPCPSRVATWGRKKEREGWGFSRFWHSRPPTGRPARRAISSVVERAPDNCVVVPGL